MRISIKMIIGYLLLIVLPFIIFTLFIYYQLYEKLLTQYQLTNQQNLEQMADNLDSSLGKIESLFSIYQNNGVLVDYLNGEYTEDRDLVYNYLKEISPAISFAYLAEPSVKSIVIYPKLQKRLLTVPGIEAYNKVYEKLSNDEIEKLRSTIGLWKRRTGEDGLNLAYYHKIYNDSYTQDLGIIEMDVKPDLFGSFLHKLQNEHVGNAIILTASKGEVLQTFNSKISNGQVSKIVTALEDNRKKPYFIENLMLVNSVTIPRLGLTVIEVNKLNMLFKLLWAKLTWIIGGGGLLILLSALYYLIVSSMTRRIVLLSRHMQKIGQDSIRIHYTNKIGKDEIGFLIMNYNAMITRIHELVHHVQKVELLKREADFRMLQAQIQPHFLFNTLETMRMLARSNKHHKVEEMAFILGNLLRYSLSKNNNITLKDEFEHVKAYISIHQIRMSDLTFEMDEADCISSIPCPHFILQPLVENSMVHGLSRKRANKRIVIKAKVDRHWAIVEVSDNGRGIEEEKLYNLQRILMDNAVKDDVDMQGMGIGLNNVAERIKAYYGQESSLTIKSTLGKGTTCSLILDLKEKGYAQTIDRG